MSDFIQVDCGPMRPCGLKIRAGTFVTLFQRGQGWLMIDSGYGIADVHNPNLVTRLFCAYVRTPLKEGNCAIQQLAGLGIDPKDVSDIILTHLHLDHAGGISDFPWDRVHILRKELRAAEKHRGRLGIGYLARQWQHGPHWQIYESIDSDWFGFPAMRVNGIKPDVFMIPAPGHSPGHAMVAFRTKTGWVLQTGSAGYPAYGSDDDQQAKAPAWFKRWLMGDYTTRLQTLWEKHHEEITFLSSHEFRRDHSVSLIVHS